MCDLCKTRPVVRNTSEGLFLNLCSINSEVLTNVNKEIMKNIAEELSNWNETKGKLKQKFTSLTDHDVLFVDGNQDKFIGRLQIKLGKSKEEIHKLISEL